MVLERSKEALDNLIKKKGLYMCVNPVTGQWIKIAATGCDPHVVDWGLVYLKNDKGNYNTLMYDSFNKTWFVDKKEMTEIWAKKGITIPK